jgi:hypothetical protein
MMPRMLQRRRRFTNRVGRAFAIAAVALAPLLAAPSASLAARGEGDAPDPIEGRLEGYAGGKTLPASGQALTWIACIILALIAAAGLFKDAKRSHLD